MLSKEELFTKTLNAICNQAEKTESEYARFFEEYNEIVPHCWEFLSREMGFAASSGLPSLIVVFKTGKGTDSYSSCISCICKDIDTNNTAQIIFHNFPSKLLPTEARNDDNGIIKRISLKLVELAREEGINAESDEYEQSIVFSWK
jgi:hypothetical protein